jgi:hypothetical protein
VSADGDSDADPDHPTVVFELAALRRLAEPGAALADAREWTVAVGLVSTEPAHIETKFARDHGLDPDFRSGPGGVNVPTLEDAAANTPDGRHVYVGTTAAGRETAEEAGWEYRSIETAAERAGWDLAADADSDADSDAGPDANADANAAESGESDGRADGAARDAERPQGWTAEREDWP